MIRLLGAAGLAACWLPFLSAAPNRLVSGRALSVLHSHTWPAAAFIGGMAVLAAMPRRWGTWPALVIACGTIWCVLLAAGHIAAHTLIGASSAARVGFGLGFFALLAVASLAVLASLRGCNAGVPMRLAVAAVVLGGIMLIAQSGALHTLSLAQEYEVNRVAFHAALIRHLLLVALTLAGAAIVGVPLGIAVWRAPSLRPTVFSALNVVQTVPSVALFGLLITPLAAAGLSGIGIVPAVTALVLYALLPTVRGLVTGLDGVPAAPLEAAAGMGMAPSQVFLRIRLPLAAPALLSALRIVTVQAVGLAVVAALIGAGGLGDFVFQGLGQYAIDLVLLGALPATGLALLADATISLIASAVQAGGLRPGRA
jgi:osmoprotectant transport system permease protein